VKLWNLWEPREGDRRELKNGVEEIVDAVNDREQVRTAAASNNDWEEDEISVAICTAAQCVLRVIFVARSSDRDPRGNCGHNRCDFWIIERK